MTDLSKYSLKIKQAVESLFESNQIHLPEMASFLPLKSVLKAPESRLLIVDFMSLPNGDTVHGYGQAIGDAIRMIMSDLPSFGFAQAVYVPKVTIGTDYEVMLDSKGASEQQLSQRQSALNCLHEMSIDHVLKGSITDTGSGLQADILLVAVGEHDTVIKEMSFTIDGYVELSKIVKTVIKMLVSFYQPKPSAQSASLITQRLVDQELSEYAEIVATHGYDGAYERRCKLKKKFNEYDSILMAFYCLNQASTLFFTKGRFTDTLKIINEKFSGHSYLLALLIPESANDPEDREVQLEKAEGNFMLTPLFSKEKHHSQALGEIMIDKLCKRPEDLFLALSTADMLNSLGEMRRSLVLMIEVLVANPQFRMNWVYVAEQLGRLAFQFRGEEWWDDVPDRDQRLFVNLSGLAMEAADAALAVYPKDASLLEARMRFEYGTTDDLVKYFLKGVEANPQNESLYSEFIHYTQPRWGGWYELQMAALALAFKHNPKAYWPWRLMREYIINGGDYGLIIQLKTTYKTVFQKKWYLKADTDVLTVYNND